MFKKITTNTKHIAVGDVFFCCYNAEKYLTIDVFDKVSQIYCENGFKNRIIKNNLLSAQQLTMYDNKIIECDKLQNELTKQLKQYYHIPSKLIAITGTKGKTSTCWFLMQLLGFCYKKCGYIGTLGVYFCDNCNIEKLNKEDTLTTPSIDDLYYFLDIFHQKNAECVVFEASSHSLCQNRVDGLHVDCGVFTNLSQDHLDYHKTMNEYFNAKSLLFSKYQNENDNCILNADDEMFESLFKICKNKHLNITSIGKKENSDVKIISIKQLHQAQQVVFTFQEQTFKFESYILGEFQMYNLLEAIMACHKTFNAPINDLCKITTKIKAPIGRMQKIENTNIFIDFAHTPKSLEESINLLKTKYKKVVVVFGCGGNRDKQKRPIMFAIATKLADYSIITTDNQRFENPIDIINDIICFAQNNINNELYNDMYVKNEIEKINENYKNNNNYFIVIVDRSEAIKYAIKNYKKNNTAILIAGKGHEQYQIIGDKKVYYSDFDEVDKILKLNS